MAFTKLHRCTCEDEKLAEVADENAETALFWFMLLAAAPPWGRFPLNPRKLKIRVCPFIGRLTAESIPGHIERLCSRGMLVRYVCAWSNEQCLAVAHYSEYNNAGYQYHKMGKPEFSPPPDWDPPRDLTRFVESVRLGKFRGRKYEAVCELFGVPQVPGTTPTDDAYGQVPGTYPKRTIAGSGVGGEHHVQEIDGYGDGVTQVPGTTPTDRSLRTGRDGDGDGVTTNDNDVSGEGERRAPLRSSYLGVVAAARNGEQRATDGPDATREDDIRAIRQVLASVCKDGTDESDLTIGTAVSYQIDGCGRDIRFVMEQAMDVVERYAPRKAEGKSASIQQVTANLRVRCQRNWDEWQRVKPGEWERANGPKPRDATDAAHWQVGKQAWEAGDLETVRRFHFRIPGSAA